MRDTPVDHATVNLSSERLSERNNFDITRKNLRISLNVKIKFRPPFKSELTSMIFNTELTHLGSEDSK